MQYNLEELLALENNTILCFKGKELEINTRDGKYISGVVTGFELAANPPHLVCSITINGIKTISFQRIKKLSILS